MNRSHLFLSAMFLGLVGCGANLEKACEDYVAAAKECNVEACGDDTACAETANAAYTDTFCDSYANAEGDAAKAAEEQLDCYTAALDAADCSSVEKLAELTTAYGECAAAPAS